MPLDKEGLSDVILSRMGHSSEWPVILGGMDVNAIPIRRFAKSGAVEKNDFSPRIPENRSGRQAPVRDNCSTATLGL